MVKKRGFQNKYILAVVVVLFLVGSSFFVSGSFLKFDGFSKETLSSFSPLIDDDWSTDWFDGSFEGVFGENTQYLDGEIVGFLNLGRSSSVGCFQGEWNRFDTTSSGTVQGRFRNNVIVGIVKTDESSFPFIGSLWFNDTNFQAVIISVRLSRIFIEGAYESSFLPPLTGPYGVGVKSFHLVDESRFELFTPDDPDDLREMMMQLWYPVDKDITEPRAEYMDEPTFAWLMDRSPIPLVTIPGDAYRFVRPHTKFEVAIAEDDLMFPVIIFSPGYNGVYQIYTSLIEDLVSNGFVVASINHPYVSGITVFPDGRKIYSSSLPSGDIGIRSVVEDAKFVLDTLEDLNSSDPMFLGRFDLSKVGMYGHSFGGAATSICCYEDDRFVCGLTLDGVFYTDYIAEGLDKPFLLMIAELRFNDANVQEKWGLLSDDAFKVEILGATHSGFTDVGLLLNHLVPLIPPRFLGFGTIAPKVHVSIMRMFELVFFEVYLKGRAVEDLISLGSVFEEVVFEWK
ncbi:MAG: hypothetical protein R6V50_00595 [Thermoplasmatota archaeon]